MKHRFLNNLAGLLLLAGLTNQLSAQVPGLLNFEGRVLTDGAPFQGSGRFKFALVNGSGSVTHWSNDGSAINGNEPTDAVPITGT